GADDRRRAAGIEAGRAGDDGLVDRPVPARVVDEVEIVDRQHDRARGADRALVVGREEHRDAVARERARQGDLVPPLGPRRVERGERDTRERLVEPRAGVAVDDAGPAVLRDCAEDLEHVPPDPSAHAGSELTSIDAEPHRWRAAHGHRRLASGATRPRTSSYTRSIPSTWAPRLKVVSARARPAAPRRAARAGSSSSARAASASAAGSAASTRRPVPPASTK